MFILADTASDAVTAGLGVIAAALFFGEFAFFKWIHGPALTRADKQLEAAEDRYKEAIKAAEERYKEEIGSCRETIRRLEEKIDRQNLILEDKALPALIAATTTVSQSHHLMETLRSEQERINRARELEEARQEALRDRANNG